MLNILSNRTYRHLFMAQVIALIGTGLATVALGLLAYNLAGDRAGAVLGTALAIKMSAYILVAPVAAAFADKIPRRRMLVSLDLIRAVVAASLPFVTEVWEIYVLIFILQSASAAFTPTFQATIPDILPDEREYTRALSLSRLAYDLESVISPVLAATLLTVMSFHNLFAGTVVGFLASAALVVSVTLPKMQESVVKRGIYEKTTRGVRIFLKTPRLRGLLALNMGGRCQRNGHRQYRRTGAGQLWFISAFHSNGTGSVRSWFNDCRPGPSPTARQDERSNSYAGGYGDTGSGAGYGGFP
jgi:MFS family permease